MDLTFVQTSNMFGRDGAWETEFSVDQEFNLHLERESSGKIIMMQKTAGTFFDIVKDFDMKSGDVVYDYDSASFLGTKTIKIVSESAIRFASLTTSGEVTEIKSQSKEIEVTSNGTTEITPDAGFAYLNSVKVKTNVAQGGGSGGGTELEGEYFLAKPNGRYWKSKLARMERGKYPSVMGLKSDFTEAQLESLVVGAEFFAYCAFSAIGDRGGIPSSGYEVFYESPNRVAARCATDVNSIYSTDDRVALLGAWQECGFTMLIPGMESVYVKNGLVDFIRLTAEGELDGVSDDEVLAMASEMLMIEQVTKEEYESWYNW